MTAVVLLALLAPAPIAKAPTTPAIKCGAYVMTWRGVEAPTVFHSDGFYACHWQGRWWHGQWTQEKGQLRVEEWPMDDPSARTKWTIKLSGPMAGILDGGSAWKLAPQAFGSGAGDA
jgi:hypothetical protein